MCLRPLVPKISAMQRGVYLNIFHTAPLWRGLFLFLVRNFSKGASFASSVALFPVSWIFPESARGVLEESFDLGPDIGDSENGFGQHWSRAMWWDSCKVNTDRMSLYHSITAFELRS